MLRIHQYISELKNDIEQLIIIYKNKKIEYHNQLVIARKIPFIKQMLNSLIQTITIGYYEYFNENKYVQNKLIIVHKKYLPLLESMRSNISELITDYKKYSEIDKTYFIKVSVYLNADGYPSNWNEISLQVRERDGFKCKYCNSIDKILHVHHIIPLSKGGSNSLSNLITLCENCHKRKHPHMR